MFVVLFLASLVLLVIAVVATIPPFHAGLLRVIRWSALPVVGRTTGVAATALLFAASCVTFVAAAIMTPPAREAVVEIPAPSATLQPRATPTTTVVSATLSPTVSPARTTVPPSPSATPNATAVPTPTPAAPTPPVIATAPPPPPTARLAITITASTYGFVAATTAPGASCSASGVLPSGGPVTSAGLQGAHTADSNGNVSWSYQRGSNTRAGTGTHTVACTTAGQTASASASFTVQ